MCGCIGLIGVALAQRTDDDKPEISETVLKHRDTIPRRVDIPDGSPTGKLEEMGFKHPKLFRATKDPDDAQSLEARRQQARGALSDPESFTASKREARRHVIESVRNAAQRQALLKAEEDIELDRQDALDTITKPQGREERARAGRNSKSLRIEGFAMRSILHPDDVEREMEPKKTQMIRDREEEALKALSVAKEFWNEERHLKEHGTRRPSKIESKDGKNAASSKGGQP